MMPHMGPLRERVSTGVRWGLLYATVYSAVGLVSVLSRGPAVLKPYHLTVLEMIVVYFASGLVGGSVFGLLMPLGRSLVGAVFLGWLVMAPIALLMSLLVARDVRVGSQEFIWVWVVVSLLGPVCGAAFWIRSNQTH